LQVELEARDLLVQFARVWDSPERCRDGLAGRTGSACPPRTVCPGLGLT
jgi:hypothetical protein